MPIIAQNKQTNHSLVFCSRIKELEKELENTRLELQEKEDKLRLFNRDKEAVECSMKEVQQYADDMSTKLELLQNTTTEDKKQYKSQITKLTDDLRDTTDKLDILKREYDDISTR